jgi:Double zinc ribbon
VAAMTEHDWYAYLQLPPEATTGDIEQAVERLSRQASALAVTTPERSQLLRETIRAIKRDLLSGPESRPRYDAPRSQRPAAPAPVPPAGTAAWPVPAPPRPAPPAPPGIAPAPPAPVPPAAADAPAPLMPSGPGGQGVGSRLTRFLRTGWTCPGCGKGAVPSDKFCTKCGTPIRPIQPDAGSERDRAPRPRSVCPSCANPLGPMDVFCSMCGAQR